MPATPDNGPDDRPHLMVFEFARGRFEILDAPRFLVALPPSFQPVLQPGTWPSPLSDVGIFLEQGVDTRSNSSNRGDVTSDDTGNDQAGGGQAPPRVLRLQGRVTITTRTLGSLLDPGMLGNEYVAPLVDAVSRLLIAGGLSGRGGTGSTGEASSAGRRWNVPESARIRNSTPPTTPPDATIHSKNLDISAAVRYGRTGFDGRVTHTIDASVRWDDASPDHVAEFVHLVCDYARRQVGCDGDDAFLQGRVYTLSRRPPAATATDPAGGDEDLVGLDQIGGLDDVVRQLREIAESFRHPEVMARWGARRPQGVLMFGPPGSGKTTLAKALAVEIGATLKEIRTPDIMTKWVGQSERNVKKIFTEARTYRTPTVLLFDEFDSIVSYTGAPQGSADQALNSVAGIFKQEMNTLVADNPNIIVVATTNFPQRVDDSLIRSGRFDVKLAVPLPDGPARADIFGKKIRRLASRHSTASFSMFDAGLDLTRLADLTVGMSGADIEEILRRVQMAKAMQEARGSTAEAISQHDLEEAISRMRPRFS